MTDFKFTKIEKIALFFAFLILLILFISSSMTYHQQEMNPATINRRFGFLEPIIKNWNLYYGGVWHNRVSDNGLAPFTQFVVRKLAHFGTYFLLGLFAYIGLRRIFIIKWTAPFFVWTACIAAAALDEFHQFLTGDRTPSVHDVILDGTGSLCAIIICLLFFLIRAKIEKNQR